MVASLGFLISHCHHWQRNHHPPTYLLTVTGALPRVPPCTWLHTIDEDNVRLQALLDSPDDIALFEYGGCAVFASILHERFGYAMSWVPGHEQLGGVAHVYCEHPVGGLIYAVDVLGTTLENVRVPKFGLTKSRAKDVSELRKLPKGRASPRGLCREEWFVAPASERARRRIDQFIGHFDGTHLSAIADARL